MTRGYVGRVPEPAALGQVAEVDKVEVEIATPAEVLPPEDDDFPDGASLVLYVDSGEAPPKIISDVLVALNDLNIAGGGLGLVFRTDGQEIHAAMGVEQ